MIQETVARVPDQTALAVKRNGVWVKWTYAEYEREIITVAKAFIKLGLQPHHSVGILGKIVRIRKLIMFGLQVTTPLSGTSQTSPLCWPGGWPVACTQPPAPRPWPTSWATAGPRSSSSRTRSSSPR